MPAASWISNVQTSHCFLYFPAFNAHCSGCPRCVHSASNRPYSPNLGGLYPHYMNDKFLLSLSYIFKLLLEASVEIRNLSILDKALNTLFFDALVPWEFGATSGEHPNHVWEQQGCWFGIWCSYEGIVIFTMWRFELLFLYDNSVLEHTVFYLCLKILQRLSLSWVKHS